MNAIIYPASLAGDIAAIASKSQAHRLLICAALADRETAISCRTLSDDILVTADCLRALGAAIDYNSEKGVFSVRPICRRPQTTALDCGESGSTLRFILPVVCALGTKAVIRMHGRLPERPLSPLWEELEAHGAALSRPSDNTLAVSGRLTAGSYTLAANISSQFISGLLFALPLLGEESIFSLSGELESASYVDMTLRALENFSLRWRQADGRFILPAGAAYRSPGALQVEGDWSNGAFWIVANRLCGGALNIHGLDPKSPQGDSAVERLVRQIAGGNAVINCQNIPDLVPILSVLAAVSPGETLFTHAGRLRIKESDRLAATAALLTALGGRVKQLPDGLAVTGVSRLSGGEVTSENDHRIAMSAAIAALVCDGPVALRGAQAVNKSYPGFWADYIRLGGRVEWEDST